VHVYWGDERSVPLEDPQSNYRLAFESWLAHVPIPGDHIHPMQARPASIDDDAKSYGELLRLLLPSPDGILVLDLVLLGLGGDGHIASLFPGTDILKESHRPVAAVYVDRLQTWRISLTFPVLNAARHVMIVVAGDSKAEIVHRVLTHPAVGSEVGPEASPRLPVQGLHPASKVEWYLDAAAARLLPPDLIGGTPS
jgi:6-phosphogluconolactonase